MNKKYLFGMLLSGALLAACTADDDLNAVKVSQVNPSAPVFTVSFDGDDLQNRGIANKGSFTFVSADKMSLFHGIGGYDAVAADGSVAPTSLAGWQNAIYKPEEGGDGGSLTFTTNSMVNPGLAVMVFPAKEDFKDLEADWTGKNAPMVKISRVQGPKTKDSIPYISELIAISDQKAHTDDGAAVAGYGKDYNDAILMKRAAGLLALKMNKINEKTVPGETLEVRSMTIALYGNDAADKYFQLQMPLKAELANSNWDTDTYTSWKYIAALNTNTIGENYKPVESITTTAISNDSAYFVLLPLGDRDLNSGTNTSGIKNSVVTVNTNFGRVTLYGNDEANEVFGKDEKTFHEWFVNTLAPALYGTAESGNFKGEKRGNYAGGSFTVDMDSLSLDGVHIANEADLKTALKAYDVIYEGKTGADLDATLILDGVKNVFTMSAATLLELENRMNATKNKGNGLRFAPCGLEARCTTIKVTGGNNTEIPSYLNFESGSLTLQLDGTWKFTSVTDDSNNRTRNVKNLIGVNKIELLANAVLGLENKIEVESSQLTGGIVVNNTATVNVTKKTTDVYVTLSNSGKIVISANGELRATGTAGKIVNEAESQSTDPKKQISGLTATKYGKIENSGILGVVTGTDGRVENYGVIEVMTTGANTLVSTNATTSAAVNKGYGEVFYGSILIDKAAEDKVTVNGEKGFIKKTIKTAKPNEKTIGDLANYIILADGCTEITADEVDEDGTLGLPKIEIWKQGVKYIEVQTKNTISFTGTTNQIYLEGLIVPTGCRVDIGRGVKVTFRPSLSMIYKKGTIVNGGTITYNSKTNENLEPGLFTGYFGTDGDKDITTVTQQ